MVMLLLTVGPVADGAARAGPAVVAPSRGPVAPGRDLLTVTAPRTVRSGQVVALSTRVALPQGSRVTGYVVDFGDGTRATGRTLPPALRHRWPRTGRFVVSTTLHDRRHVVAAARTPVTVGPALLAVPAGPVLALGYHLSCAARAGVVRCAGVGTDGQLGNGSRRGSATPVIVALPAGRAAVSVSTAGRHACALLADGGVVCWGDNQMGELGDRTTVDRPRPVLVALPGGRGARSVSTGSDSTCAILDDGSLACWGSDFSGQLGDGRAGVDVNPAPVHVALPVGRAAVAVSAGESACALLDDGSIVCWGRNYAGELGNGTTTGSSRPVRVALPPAHRATGLMAGDGGACAVLEDGSAVCWGRDVTGAGTEAGPYPQQPTSSTPQPVTGLPPGRRVQALSGGGSHTCALLDDGSAACWGDNSAGALGDGSRDADSRYPVPVRLPASRRAMGIAAGYQHTCAALDDASTVCWGGGDSGGADGELGTGQLGASGTPVAVAGLSVAPSSVGAPAGGQKVDSVSMANGHACAVLAGGRATCWGSNSQGELGDGTTTDSPVPVPVALPAGRRARGVSVGGGYGPAGDPGVSAHSCALLDDGTAVCWGSNTNGELGVADVVASARPVLVPLPDGRTATAVTAGATHSCALLRDGSVACWGYDGTSDGPAPPGLVALPPGRTALGVSAGSYHSCAALDDGSAVCWGVGYAGDLGDADNYQGPQPTPVALPAGRRAVAVSAGLVDSCLLLDDGTIWCYGQGQFGETGSPLEPFNYTSTVTLPPSRRASTVSAGGEASCARLDDGSAICWGGVKFGELGDGADTLNGQETDTAVPRRVLLPPGSGAADVTVGLTSACAALDSGGVVCWGSNTVGQLGNGYVGQPRTPVPSLL